MTFIAQTQTRVKACFDTEAEADEWLEGCKRDYRAANPEGIFRGVVFEADVPLGDALEGLGATEGLRAASGESGPQIGSQGRERDGER